MLEPRFDGGEHVKFVRGEPTQCCVRGSASNDWKMIRNHVSGYREDVSERKRNLNEDEKRRRLEWYRMSRLRSVTAKRSKGRRVVLEREKEKLDSKM